MHVHQLIELLFIGFHERYISAISSVVDQGIEALNVPVTAQYLHQFGAECRKAGDHSGVELQRRRFTSMRLDRGDGFSRVLLPFPVSDDDIPPVLRRFPSISNSSDHDSITPDRRESLYTNYKPQIFLNTV